MRRGKRRLALTLTLVLVGSIAWPASRAIATPAPAEEWAVLPWDSAVGRIQGREADSFGPMSFALKPDGGVLVLDQVNLRVLDFDADGTHLADLPLPAATFDDVEQYEGRAVLALDRLGAKALLVLDMAGTPISEVSLEGRGIAHSGRVTALLPRPDGVWLEVNNRYSVGVLDRQLQPCRRHIVLGRPIAGGRSLPGAKDDAGGVQLWTDRRNARSQPAPVTVTGADPIRRIVWMDETPDGHLVAAFHEIRRSAESPFPKRSERTSLVVFDSQLSEVARHNSPWVLTLYNQRVEVRVGPQGHLWQMAFDEVGVHLLRWDWRAP